MSLEVTLVRPMAKRCCVVGGDRRVGEGCDSCLEMAPGRVVRQRGSYLVLDSVRMRSHFELPHCLRRGRGVGVGPSHVKVKERDRGEREVVSFGTLLRLFWGSRLVRTWRGGI